MIITPGAQSQTITIQIVDDSGLAVTGLVAATFPTTSYERSAEALVGITLSDLAALTSAYNSGGVKEVGGGYYRLDVPDAAFATASRVRIIGEATGKHVLYPPITVQKLAATLGSGDYSGNTVQTGDVFARVGPNGVGLTAVSLTGAERTAIANEVEAQIIDETDSEKVLAAITDKIASVNPSLAGLTLSAIAAQVRTNLAAELARIDVATSTRLATSGYTAPANPTDYARNNVAPSWWIAPDNADIVTALSDLVTLLGRTDPTTAIAAIKLVTDKLATMLNATPQFTATALALAPAAPIYGQSGSIPYTYTVYDQDGTTPLAGAAVYVSSDIGGTNRSATKLTDSLGRVVFNLNTGPAYFWSSRYDRAFTNPVQEQIG